MERAFRPRQPAGVLCRDSTRAVSCCLSREQPEGRGPGHRADRPSVPASKVRVREPTAATDMKRWERAKELAAITDRLSSLPA